MNTLKLLELNKQLVLDIENLVNIAHNHSRCTDSIIDEIVETITKRNQALQLLQTDVSGSAWIEVLSDHEITEYSKKLEPIWVILEEDETKTPILCQPDGHDNYYGSDDIIYHYCDISHFMKIQRPIF